MFWWTLAGFGGAIERHARGVRLRVLFSPARQVLPETFHAGAYRVLENRPHAFHDLIVCRVVHRPDDDSEGVVGLEDLHRSPVGVNRER